MLVAIDAGHGHNTAGKRCPDDSMREHDFNGNVATMVCDILNRSGIETYRSDDITGVTDVPLITRTRNINAKNAKICVSIHANANTGDWNSANGIETYIIARGGQAEKIANIIQAKLISYTGRRNRGVKVGNLHMVRETKMPAILCECGFMDNREEAELLKSEEYRQKCANAIADAILEYLQVKRIDNVVEQPKQPKQENTSKYVLGKYVVSNATRLNVRSGPGTNYGVKKTYTKNTRFDTYEIKNNWARTPSGWVCLDYCSLVYKY